MFVKCKRNETNRIDSETDSLHTTFAIAEWKNEKNRRRLSVARLSCGAKHRRTVLYRRASGALAVFPSFIRNFCAREFRSLRSFLISLSRRTRLTSTLQRPKTVTVIRAPNSWNYHLDESRGAGVRSARANRKNIFVGINARNIRKGKHHHIYTLREKVPNCTNDSDGR